MRHFIRLFAIVASTWLGELACTAGVTDGLPPEGRSAVVAGKALAACEA